MKKIIIALFAGSLMLGASCTKVGPMGPQGPSGNANVWGSSIFTVSSWSYSSNTYSGTFLDPDITTAVAASGVVEVFKQYSDGTWTNLPDINNNVATVFNFYQGGFTIYINSINGATTPAPGVINFRAVVIPSSVKLANPHVNWKNYNEAMAALEAAKEGTNSAQ